MSSNLCVICGIDMGEDNPRQLCGKTDCDDESLFFEIHSSFINGQCWINRLVLKIAMIPQKFKNVLFLI